MLSRLRALPVTVKVPLVVVLVTVAVSVVISERVLSRLGTLQREHLSALSSSYLDGLTSSLLPAMLRDDTWEVFDTLDRARQLYASLNPVETIVTKSGGEVVASTDPDRVPVLSQLSDALRSQFDAAALSVNEDGTRALLNRDLVYQDRSIGTIYATLDIAHLVAERHAVLRTLIATNAALAVVFAALGYFAVNRMVRPIRVLADHLEGRLAGEARPIDRVAFPGDGNPFNRLFTSFNALVAAEKDREALALRLADEEKVASLGRLASGMAHEINNPLGGLFNAIDTLKAHGEKPVVRASSLALIERGLSGIRDVVRAALMIYRPGEPQRLLAHGDFDDLRLLLGSELRRRQQTLDWRTPDSGLPALQANPIRQVILNLLLNASAASGMRGSISLHAFISEGGELLIEVGDSGPGMPRDAAGILTGDRSYALLRDERGLGLWMVQRLVGELGGTIGVSRSALGGAEIRLLFKSGRQLTVDTDAA